HVLPIHSNPPTPLPLFFFHCSPPHPHLPPFPTRRSSDLSSASSTSRPPGLCLASSASPRTRCSDARRLLPASVRMSVPVGKSNRSEEHTSELQSRENLVCRLLLEKKKQNMAAVFKRIVRW